MWSAPAKRERRRRFFGVPVFSNEGVISLRPFVFGTVRHDDNELKTIKFEGMTVNSTIEILRIVIWPLVTLIVVLRFGRAIEGLIPGTKLKFKFAGIEIDTSLKELTTVIQETYRREKIDDKQWAWLERLKKDGKSPYNHATDYEVLRPLRNSGLIHEHPEGHLTSCKFVSITPLGELLLKAKQNKTK
jgi:hypothetical protein